jgi:RNA 2',3'-cyclic 3'-phosphodiesterase
MKPEPQLPAPAADLFYALWPDATVRDALAGWGKAVQRAAGGRPTRASKLHMTLAYLGPTAPERIAVAEGLCNDFVMEPFTMILDTVGYWKNNRIAWAGCRDKPRGLDQLIAGLRAALGAAGLRFDSKSFVPHLTLVWDAKVPPSAQAPAPIEWKVKSFVLFETVRGADYRLWAESPAGPG